MKFEGGGKVKWGSRGKGERPEVWGESPRHKGDTTYKIIQKNRTEKGLYTGETIGLRKEVLVKRTDRPQKANFKPKK